VWQWIHQDRTTEDGTRITREYVEGLIAQVLDEVRRPSTGSGTGSTGSGTGSTGSGTDSTGSGSDGDRFDDAAEVFREVALGSDFPAFLTLPAYSRFLVETD